MYKNKIGENSIWKSSVDWKTESKDVFIQETQYEADKKEKKDASWTTNSIPWQMHGMLQAVSERAWWTSSRSGPLRADSKMAQAKKTQKSYGCRYK